MSLLDNGPDALTVTPEIVITDDRRNPGVRVPGTTVIEVFGRLQPVSSDESAADGQDVSSTHRFICREFPAGPWSRIARGDEEFDVVGEPARRTGSARTRHDTVSLRSRSPRS